MSADFLLIETLALSDVKQLSDKEKSYGDSWKRRGGVGAFMMLARKWDRIENQAKKDGETPWDIFSVGVEHDGMPDGILDDIRDLRRYLLLVDAEICKLTGEDNGTKEEAGPTKAYVCQE